MELGGLWWTNALYLALPPQRHSLEAWLEHQEPVIHTAAGVGESPEEVELPGDRHQQQPCLGTLSTQKPLVAAPYLLYPFICQWTFRLFPCEDLSFIL